MKTLDIRNAGRWAGLGIGALLAVAPLGLRAQDPPVLVAGATVKIPGSKGGFDFLEVDPGRHRLLAAHEGDDTADLVDLETNTLITRVKIAGAPVHLATDAKTGRYFVSAQGGKRVVVVDGSTLKETGSIPMEGPLDAILFVPASRRLYVANDDGSRVWVVDADAQKLVGSITIPGAPEYMVYDPGADRLYVNIKTTSEVVAIDPKANTVAARWPTAPATHPHGLAFDPDSGRLFSAGDNGKLAVIDVKTGKVVAVADITPKVDQIAFDPGTRRVYCAGSDRLSVVQETADGAVVLGSVKTAASARNVAVDTKTHAVWTTYSDGVNAYAQSWVAAGAH
jgi:DNA-binding beta-propeller fold protein YncE